MTKTRNRDSERRLVLLDVLRGRSDHPDAQSCVSIMRQHIPHIGQSTVYRHLDQLVKQGLIQIITVGNGPVRYDARYGLHAHFQCTSCKSVIDIFPPPLDIQWPGQVDTITLIAHGTCANCQKSPNHQMNKSPKE